jgi:hypothetical protein
MKVVLFIFLALAFMASCSKSIESDKCPCKVKIPQLQEDGTYKLEVVDLPTLENPKNISGSRIRVTGNPRFFSDGSIDEVRPVAHYIINNDGVIIPTTSDTSEMFSIYKIMEDLYLFDKSIGVDQILSYPRTVSLQARGGKNKKSINDAFYVPYFDRTVVLKYTGAKVPLSINMGVLSHEHFHSIFNKIVDPVRKTTNDMGASSLHNQHTKILPDDSKIVVSKTAGYNYLILKALDEGLADYWANLQTGLANPYSVSYSEAEHMEDRVVVARVMRMYEQKQLEIILDYNKFKEESNSEIHSTEGTVYGNGVMYSNFLKSISEKMLSDKKDLDNKSQQEMIGKWIVESLKKLSVVVSEKGKTEILSQADIMNNFVPSLENREILNSICADFDLFLTYHNKVSSCSR